MDIQDNNNNMTLNTIKTPEAESETPTRIQSSNPKPLPFSNGLLKRHPLTQTPPPQQPTVFVYRECLKNHAANLGGHALDGCGEFMSSPSSTPTDPTSLKCAACGCHRNFHRRSTDQYQSPNSRALIEYQPHHRHHPPPPDGGESPNSPSPPPISSAYYPASAPHMLLALSAGLSGQQPENSPAIGHVTAPNGRKRFRTKFTQNQKERMLEFAEKIGWKFQKRDEDVIAEFCNEIGVERGVLKVWMHNNKSTRGHRSELNNSNNGGGGGGVGDGGGNHENNGNEMEKRMRENNSSSESRENHHRVGGGPVNGGNASSSSS